MLQENNMPRHHMGGYGDPVIPASADQAAIGAALTDSTTGTSSTTLAAGVGVETLLIPIVLAGVTDADVLTTLTLGYKFKVLSFDAFVTTAVTTAAKATSLNLEIGTTNVTGGVIALTSANCTPLGAKVAGSAITAANTGSSSDTLSIEASSTTAFVEGEVVVQIAVQNMDTADALASLAARANSVRTLLNCLRTDLITQELIKGSA